MINPFEGDNWKDAVILSAVWSGAPGRSGNVSMAIVERDGITSIWQWDDEEYVSPEMLARYKGKYDVRLVSRAISEIEEGGICASEIDGINVDGETGWQADLLAIAWWRDGEWDCTASPLTSILLTLTDDELQSLTGKIGTLRNIDLLAVASHIDNLRQGSDSAFQLLEKGIVALMDCDTDDRDDVLEEIEEDATDWIKQERQRKLSWFAGQYELALGLKERELLSEAGRRTNFGQRVAQFRSQLEGSIYIEHKLSPEAQRVIGAEGSINAIPANNFDDAFSKEELENLTEFEPPFSAEARARILRAWGNCGELPSKFGKAVSPGLWSSNPFHFLAWLIGDQIESVLSGLNGIDPKSAQSTVDRILKMANDDARRLADPKGFSGMWGAMGRAVASGRVRQALEFQLAAKACGIPFDQDLSLAADNAGAKNGKGN